MAAYVPTPRDLSKVKSKILFNLTKRQLICFGAAALVGLPAFFLLKGTGNISLATLGMMLIMLPFFLLAMYEKDGQPLEVIIRQIYEAKFVRPKVRVYETNNLYELLMKQHQVEKEVYDIVFHSEKEKVRISKDTRKSDKTRTKKDKRNRSESKKR